MSYAFTVFSNDFKADNVSINQLCSMEKKLTFFSQFELCKVCINNNICNDRCKMSNYITQYENNMCMYTSMGQ